MRQLKSADRKPIRVPIKLVTEGTIGFTFVFTSGFTIVWFDSVGVPNAEERALASELAPVDVAIFPWTVVSTQAVYPRSP
jgi:hypothetical protein